MSDFPKIINWENVFSKLQEFENSENPKFTFIENWIENDFYEKLYETFPDISIFTKIEQQDKTAFRRWWGTKKDGEIADPDEEDGELSPEWNLFYKYLHSEEFIENISNCPESKCSSSSIIVILLFILIISSPEHW